MGLSLGPQSCYFNQESKLFSECMARHLPSILYSVGPGTRPVCWALPSAQIGIRATLLEYAGVDGPLQCRAPLMNLELIGSDS